MWRLAACVFPSISARRVYQSVSNAPFDGIERTGKREAGNHSEHRRGRQRNDSQPSPFQDVFFGIKFYGHAAHITMTIQGNISPNDPSEANEWVANHHAKYQHRRPQGARAPRTPEGPGATAALASALPWNERYH
jgi:hypothetical protein